MFIITIVSILNLCQAETPSVITAKVPHAESHIKVSVEIPNRRWAIGQELVVVVRVENCSSSTAKIFDPLHDLLRMTSEHSTRLEILDARMQRIGDLVAWEGGSNAPLHPSFWVDVPADSVYQNELELHYAGYVPRTKFIKGEELPSGVYYLRLVVTDSFLLTDVPANHQNQRQLAVSEAMRVELVGGKQKEAQPKRRELINSTSISKTPSALAETVRSDLHRPQSAGCRRFSCRPLGR